MRVALFSAVTVVPLVTATPQAYGYGFEHLGRHHHKHHQPSGVSSSTGVGLPTGGTSAPYGFGNSTTRLGSTGFATGTQVVSTTIHHTVFKTLPSPSSSAIEAANDHGAQSSILSVPSAAGSASVNEGAAGSVGTCGSGIVTMTYNPTYTVTVTPSRGSGGGVSTASSTFATSVPEDSIASSQLPESASSNVATITTNATSSLSEATIVPSTPVSTPETKKTSSPTTADIQSTEAPVTPTSASQSEVFQSDASPDTTSTVTPTLSTSQVRSSSAIKPITTVPSTSAYPVTSSKPAAGGKRGILASGDDQDALVSAFDKSSKITWLCNWYSAPPPNLDSHIEFVPQDYGRESNTAPKYEWTTNAKQAIAKGAKYFLGFGEPETPNTATMHTNMDPDTAVDLFMSDLQPYALQGIKVGAPAVLQPDPDLAWLKQFMAGCEEKGCKISFVAVHWVWSATPAERVEDFKDTVNNATAIANGKPVWVDNFQASGTNEEQQQWLSQVLPWLESNDAVERYAYVSPSRNTGTGFLNADGSMSSLGEFYASF